MKRMIGLLMMVGMVIGVGCSGDKDSPTGSSEEITKWTYGDGHGYSIQQTVDGGFIVTGGDDGGVLLLKVDGQGIEQWRKTFGDGYGWGNSVQQTVDGGFIVTGYNYNSDGDEGYSSVLLL